MRLPRSFATTAALLSLSLQRTQAQQKIVPAPNGTYNVGLSIVQVTDASRHELFAPSPQAVNLEVSIFYPTSEKETQDVLYFPPETARFIDLEYEDYYALNSPNGTFEKLGMVVAANDSHVASPPASKWPILLFSGAAGTTRLFYNSIASHIASYGYVVVTIDTPYDTDIVQYTDGTIATINTTLLAEENTTNITQGEALGTEDTEYRAANSVYVLDQLSNQTFTAPLIPGCDNCLNTTHVGIFGHSIGGASAATAMLNDTRLAGGIDYDGAIWGPVTTQGLDRPFMLMGHTNHTVSSSADFTWQEFWSNLSGERYAVQLANSLHYDFSDLPVMLETLGITPNATSMAAEQITTLNGDRALYIVVSYTVAFFDQVLKGNVSELLKGPDPQFWEISFDNGTLSSSSGNGSGSGITPSTGGASNMKTGGLSSVVLLGVTFAVMFWSL